MARSLQDRANAVAGRWFRNTAELSGEVYDEEPRCPLCACQEHKPRLLAAGDHSAPAAVSPGTGQGRKGVQPELPRGRPVLLSATARRCPEPMPANAPRQRRPGSPLPAAPRRGPSRAHTAAVRARPYPTSGITSGPSIRPGCGRACPGLPGTPISAACRRCHCGAERRSEAPADGSAQRTCRFERRRQLAPPLGSTWPPSRASLAGNRPAWGVSVTGVSAIRVPLTSGSHCM